MHFFENSDPSFTGEGWQFLTSFPSLSKSYNVSNETEDCQKLDDGNIVTMLTVGTSTGNFLSFKIFYRIQDNKPYIHLIISGDKHKHKA